MMTTKDDIRQRIWERLESEGIATFPRPCFGRIPNFVGNEAATVRLLELPEFRAAHCIFSAPDYALKRARDLVLERGKVLAVATPHMRSFLEIHPSDKPISTTIKGLFKHGVPLATPVDLIVQGSVAVDSRGNRLGKGKGYGDKEIAYLKERGLAKPNVKIVTIIHEVQVVDDLSALVDDNDVPVDYILTPGGVISVKGTKR
jgi:5-formyltetrahydrofolate cyclo-ligase